MKKTRLILAAIVFVSAFASAFALKMDPVVDNPAIVELGQCKQKNVTCGGTEQTCTINSVTYQEFIASSSTCGAVLKMD